uniref:Uncharacterized protein n=1 Tax=Rhizophora mucronata TaxID=61149 RepID=A0A2P2NIZ1_RHIMU
MILPFENEVRKIRNTIKKQQGPSTTLACNNSNT